ncbi:hypothetical protein ACHAXT_012445 [Thalassiosira profunda]
MEDFQESIRILNHALENGASVDQLEGHLAVMIAQREAQDPDELKKAVAKRNYARALTCLKLDKEEVNRTMKFSPDYFTSGNAELTPLQASCTGLEFAVWQGDWKMGALLFVHGADPKNNAFDGAIETVLSVAGLESRAILDGFDAQDPQPVQGFAGLRLLVDSEDEGLGEAYLYIMECLFSGSIPLHREGYRKLAGCMDALSADLRCSLADLHSFVASTYLCVKRAGLPRDAALLVVERAVLDKLWSLLEAFATRGIASEEQ